LIIGEEEEEEEGQRGVLLLLLLYVSPDCRSSHFVCLPSTPSSPKQAGKNPAQQHRWGTDAFVCTSNDVQAEHNDNEEHREKEINSSL